jgi:phosphohistidine phosphatase
LNESGASRTGVGFPRPRDRWDSAIVETIIAMKRLFLLRHAKSSWKDSSLPDHDRPLAGRGKRASKAMAAYMREHRIEPALVLCSSAIRAMQTLDGVAPGLGGSPKVRIESELYEASAAGLLGRLQRVDDAVPSVMLIGHNPSMERLALDLANGGPELAELADKYPTGALATLEFDGAWSELEADAARLVGFVKPRDLE